MNDTGSSAPHCGRDVFLHLVLGCLRDGEPRHGYDVCVELRARTGLQVNAGTVYRELAKLSSQAMIDASENPRDADVRRNPYRITERGRMAFDEWLIAPTTHGEELSSWLAFLDRVPATDCALTSSSVIVRRLALGSPFPYWDWTNRVATQGASAGP